MRYFCLMSTAKNPPPPPVMAPDAPVAYRILLWLAIFANSFFFIWQCLDRYLAPRFLFLSVVLAVMLLILRKDLVKHGDWRFHTFDGLLLGWYGLNIASVSWALSWSEGIFYAQKTLLLFTAYWLFKQAFLRYGRELAATFYYLIIGMTWLAGVIIIAQIGLAFQEKGLDNDTLYNYASGVFGNKSLASDFLFFLLICNVLVAKNAISKRTIFVNMGVLTLLILLLQTRTVYLAVLAAGIGYALMAGLTDKTIRPFFIKRILPAGGVLTAILLAVIVFRSDNSTFTERLNPLTYLESASANERRFVWYKTDQLNKDHFWWGVGSGSWKFWLPSQSIEGAYRLEEKGIIFTRAHNDYLEIRSEMGIVGAVWFVGLFLAIGLGLLFSLRNPQVSKHEAATVGAGILGYCVIQYFDFPRERIEMQVMLALFLALSAWYCRDFWAKSPGISLRRVAVPFLGLLFLGLVFNAVIGWNRVSGEIHNVKLLKAYQKQDFKTVLKEAQLSQNAFYEYNDVGLPLQWYEGTASYRMNKHDDALTAFGKAMELNPWSFQILNNYATALASLKKYQEAIPYFEKAIRINPKYDEGKFNLAYSYTQLGDYNKALEWITRVDTIPNPQTSEERQKNKTILENKGNFIKTIEQRKGE